MQLIEKAKTLIISLVLISLYMYGGILVRAQDSLDIIRRDELKIDENVSKVIDEYSMKDKIILVVFEPYFRIPIYSDEERLKEIYYFFSSRSGIYDFPFHFLINPEGQIIEANKSGEESAINIEGYRGAILIGYISSSENTSEFQQSSIDPLGNLILAQANKHGIDLENIEVKSLEVNFDEKGKVESIGLSPIKGDWDLQLLDIKESIADLYSPLEKEYTAEVSNVSLSATKAKAGEEITVKLNVKNTGENTFYGDSLSELTVIKNNPFDERSDFFVNEEWDSFSRVTLMPEGSYLGPEQEAEYEFNILIPLFPGVKTEDFILATADGNPIEATEFTLEIEIANVDGTIIEIGETEIGYLNVRSSPNFGEVIDKVEPGDRFVVIEKSDGWYKIEINGNEGWVVDTYVRVVE